MNPRKKTSYKIDHRYNKEIVVDLYLPNRLPSTATKLIPQASDDIGRVSMNINPQNPSVGHVATIKLPSYHTQINTILQQWRHQLKGEKKHYSQFDEIMKEDLANQLQELEWQEGKQERRMKQMLVDQQTDQVIK